MIYIYEIIYLNDSDNIGFPHNEVVLALIGNLGACILCIKYLVIHFHGQRFIFLSGANCHNSSALRLFLGSVRNNNTAGGFFLGLIGFNDNPVG